MRAVARLGEKRFPLYGRDPYEASRIDGFLDASLVFARDAQLYLLALANGSVVGATCTRARATHFAVYAAGIDRALAPERAYLVGAASRSPTSPSPASSRCSRTSTAGAPSSTRAGSRPF